ncbi:mCG140579 [Mus musculus]|nr:mCG140579 [Mus musculus]
MASSRLGSFCICSFSQQTSHVPGMSSVLESPQSCGLCLTAPRVGLSSPICVPGMRVSSFLATTHCQGPVAFL